MRSAFVFATALLVCGCASSQRQPPPSRASVADSVATQPFEHEIEQFEAADRIHPPPKGGVVFVGSSSIRMWPNLQGDFPGANVIQRGFGGSELWQVVNYAPRIVLPYAPARIVVYAGDNDLAAGRSPEQVLNDYRNFVTLVRRRLPDVKIAFLAVKPSGSRWALVDKMRKTNELVREFTSTDPKLVYIDTFTPMLGSDGRPRTDLFAPDSLHLNASGYAVWRGVVAPFVYEKR